MAAASSPASKSGCKSGRGAAASSASPAAAANSGLQSKSTSAPTVHVRQRSNVTASSALSAGKIIVFWFLKTFANNLKMFQFFFGMG